jgi:hypothetical protein
LFLLLSIGILIARAGESSPSASSSPSNAAPWPKPVDPPKPIETSIPALTNPPIHMVEPGIFEIGKVRLDQRKRTVTLPAELNRAEGLMEYFLVTTYGKTHESIFKTAAAPYHIHLAMLLLGASGPGKGDFPGSPANGIPGPVVHPSKEIIPGDKVKIDVSWKTATGGVVQHSAEELVFCQETQTSLGHGSWVYNGSLIIHNKFLAQGDGSVISLVTDPVALVNNTGPGHDNDMIWLANTNALPPPHVPTEMTITLEHSETSSTSADGDRRAK